MKPLPLTVSVNAAPPALAEFGFKLLIFVINATPVGVVFGAGQPSVIAAPGAWIRSDILIQPKEIPRIVGVFDLCEARVVRAEGRLHP